MGISAWVRESIEDIRRNPSRGLSLSAKRLAGGVLRSQRSGTEQAINIFDRDWEVCLVLDACRTDLMDEVIHEYEWLTQQENIWSLGATSAEWIERTFGNTDPYQLKSTAYVTWNAHSDTPEVDADEIAVLDEVWAYGWDDEIGAVPPRNITDRAIATWRENNLDRMVVHYMQPHVPFLASEGDLRRRITLDDHRGQTSNQRRIWRDLREEKVSEEDVWEAYIDNLRLVLDDIEETLLSNIDAEKIVITSDHGNGMGEWGVFGHGRNQPFAPLHKVPWCTTSATDEHSYTPEIEPSSGKNPDGNLARERLKELGYL